VSATQCPRIIQRTTSSSRSILSTTLSSLSGVRVARGADSALKRRLREGGQAPQQARDRRILLHSHRIQLRRRRFEARCTGSSYGAEAVEFKTMERSKNTTTELKEMANADHGPQLHHPQFARPRPRSACPGAPRAAPSPCSTRRRATHARPPLLHLSASRVARPLPCSATSQ
jgi:hypothetical protein